MSFGNFSSLIKHTLDMNLSAALRLFCTLIYFATMVYGSTAAKQVLTVCEGKILDNMTVITEKKAQTSLQCGRACASDKFCNSAVFSENKRFCKLLENGYRFLGEKCGCLVDDIHSDFIFKDYPCYFQQPHANGTCKCGNGYSGTFCENPPRDCDDFSTAGEYWIYIHPDVCHNTEVSCNVNGLRVIRSIDIGWSTLRNASWNTNKNFGINNEGNELMYKVTNTIYTYDLWLEIRDMNDVWHTAVYYNFRLGDEDSNYTVYFSHWASTEGSPDQVLFFGTQFRTFDHNQNFCFERYQSAFWFDDNCTYPSIYGKTAPINGALEDIKTFRIRLHRQ